MAGLGVASSDATLTFHRDVAQSADHSRHWRHRSRHDQAVV